jgi:hypothetical protein
VDALAVAIDALHKRAKDPKVKYVGLSDDLLRIAAALAELRYRSEILAGFALSKHYFPDASVHSAELEALSKMGEHAGARFRTGAHGERCTCHQCCLYRLVR